MLILCFFTSVGVAFVWLWGSIGSGGTLSFFGSVFGSFGLGALLFGAFVFLWPHFFEGQKSDKKAFRLRSFG